jgi:hypothetical protein
MDRNRGFGRDRVRAAGVVGVALLAPILVLATASVISPSQASASVSLTGMCGNALPTDQPAPQISHVIVIVGENESSQEVLGSSQAPYENGTLAAQCGEAAGMQGVTHPSLPNYLAMTSGAYPAWSLADCAPTNTSCGGYDPDPSIFSQIDSVPGLTWKQYSESMPTNCDVSDSADGLYVVRHNPAPNYAPLPSCATNSIPMGDSTTQTGPLYDDINNGTLPSYSFISPNMQNDSHQSNTIGDFDGFLSRLIPVITAGPNYQAGNTAIFVTFDEGCSGSCGPDDTKGEDCATPDPTNALPSCHIATFVIAPYVPAGTAPTTFYNLYSLLRTNEDLLGLWPLGHAADADIGSMVTDFNLAPGGLPSPQPSPTATTASPQPTPMPAQPMAVTDAGFESWPGGWIGYGGSTTVLKTVSTAHSGSVGLNIGTSSTSYAASGINDSPVTISSTVAGQTYTARCWAHGVNKLITVNAQLHEGSLAKVSKAYTFTDLTGWHWLGVSDTASTNGAKMQFSFFSTNTVAGGATFDVDDCQIGTGVATTDGTTPTPTTSDTSSASPTITPTTTPTTPTPTPTVTTPTATSTASSPAPPTNLLSNPGFETWPGGWKTYGPATTLTQVTSAHSGAHSLRIATTRTKATASGVTDSPTTVGSTVAGRRYTASCWAKATALITVKVQLKEGSQPAATSSLKLPDTTGWHQITLNYTAVTNGSSMPMSVFSTNTKAGGPTFQIDDCSLTAA